MPKTLQYQSLFEPILPLPVLVQSASNGVDGGTSFTIVLNGVAPCNTIAVAISTLASPVTVNITDDKGGAYSRATSYGGDVASDNSLGIRSDIATSWDAVGGTTTITISFNISVLANATAFELANVTNRYSPGPGTTIATHHEDPAGTTNHVCSSPALTTPTGGAFILCVGTLGSSDSATQGAGFTFDSSGAQFLIQYKIVGGSTSETGPFTTTGSLQAIGVMACLQASAGGCPERNPEGIGWYVQQPDPVPRKISFDYQALVEPVTTPTVTPLPPMGWFIEQIDGPPKAKPAAPGWFCDPTEPTLFVPQNLGWYRQQPEPPPKTKPAQPGWFCEPIVVAPPPAVAWGWYVQHPMSPPKTKVPDPGWFTEPIVVAAPVPVNMGWYVQHPQPINYRPPLREQQVITETIFVSPLVQLSFNGSVRVFDVHLVTPQVSGVHLVVPRATNTTLD